MSKVSAKTFEFAWAKLALALLVAAALLVQAGLARAETDPEAEAFISTVAEEAIGILNDQSKGQKERTDAFADLVIANADMTAIGYFTLGQYRRSATPEQLDTFMDLFQSFTKNFYSLRLAEYANQTLEVTGSQLVNNGKEVIVTSQLIQPQGSPTAVNWRLRKNAEGDYKLRDLQVVGVWLALEQRSQFTATIANNNGSIDALLDVLRERVESGEGFDTSSASDSLQ